MQIAVEDRGNGVPEDERDIIFDRFSRGSEGGNRAADTGVGPRASPSSTSTCASTAGGSGSRTAATASPAPASWSSCPIVEPPKDDPATEEPE